MKFVQNQASVAIEMECYDYLKVLFYRRVKYETDEMNEMIIKERR